MEIRRSKSSGGDWRNDLRISGSNWAYTLYTNVFVLTHNPDGGEEKEETLVVTMTIMIMLL